MCAGTNSYLNVLLYVAFVNQVSTASDQLSTGIHNINNAVKQSMNKLDIHNDLLKPMKKLSKSLSHDINRVIKHTTKAYNRMLKTPTVKKLQKFSDRYMDILKTDLYNTVKFVTTTINPSTWINV